MDPVLSNVSVAGCRPFPALLHDGRVLALAWWGATELGEITSVEQLLKRWPQLAPALRAVSESPDTTVLIAAHGAALDACRIHAPVVPRQVYCTIGNYRAQVIEAAVDAEDGPSGSRAAARREAAAAMLDRRQRDGVPYICVKPTSSVADPFAELVVSPGLPTLDWEVEIGVVIGRAAWQVEPERAFEHVAGYCVVNDITLRERVFRADPPLLGTDWIQSKGGPGWLPVGPWFVPAWRIEDPGALCPWLRLNGTTMQQGCASDMVFGIAEQISYLSRHTRLEPGDLLCTGSPAGFGSHHRRFLGAGDVVEAGVDGLGSQRIVCVGEGLPLQ
ncbi:MAG TPA: fumarylacetoacetate hydrolase family protein [Burkholderiaceae bacterium]|nr:fumarylacetoacetate hydrolase family protein [Burkholderiaceae bacterium]